MEEVYRKTFLCQVEEKSSNYIRNFDNLGPKQRTYAPKTSKITDFYVRSAEDGLDLAARQNLTAIDAGIVTAARKKLP